MHKRLAFLFFLLPVILAALPVFGQNFRKVDLMENGQSVLVFYWKSGDGALGRYTEAAVKKWEDSQAIGFLILLGRDDQAIYTLEGGIEDDAQDESLFFQLGITGFDGKRKVRIMPADKFKGNASEATLNQVWDWDKLGVLPKATDLQPIDREYPGVTDEFPKRVVRITPPTGRALTWNFTYDTEMCWFFFRWEVY